MFGSSRTRICAVGATSAHKDVSKFPREGYRSKEVPLFFTELLAWPVGPSLSIKDRGYGCGSLIELPALKMQPPALSYFQFHIAESKCWRQ